VTWDKWKLVSVHLETVLNSTQDRCIDWDEHAIGLKIILGSNNGTPLGDAGQIEARFSLFGDSANLDTR
jgi:hypothetical protein